MRILVTGGAGFVGSHLSILFKEGFPDAQVIAMDNLHRRGSELNLGRFKKVGIEFFHGDIRSPSDFDSLEGSFDVLIEASAEPSVTAGLNGSPSYLLGTNLTGTLNCLEFARSRVGFLSFLSTSRVYSIEPLRQIMLRETETRFEIEENQSLPGVSPAGLTTRFPTHLPRSLYGASKLASELLVQEYAATYGLKSIINRCGVIAGPGQFGKVDQGVFTLWVARHHFGRPLKYTGFGGTGKQVRDLLHPRDLFELITKQLEAPDRMKAAPVYNVGGGREISVSMKEMTALCEQATGRKVPIASDAASHAVDIPLYLSDTSEVTHAFGWKPETTPQKIVGEIERWLRQNEAELKILFAE